MAVQATRATATPVADLAAARRWRAEACQVAAVVVFAGALMAATWGTWGRMQADVGYDLEAAARTAHGALPYVDYDYAYGPLAPTLLGGLFRIFGADLRVAMALGAVLCAAIVAGTYLLARTVVPPPAPALAAALVAAAGIGSGGGSAIFNWILPHSYAAVLATTAGLVALLALTRSVSERGRGAAWVAGAAIAVVILARPESALPLIAVAVGSVFLAPRRGARALGLMAPPLAAVLLVYGGFAAAVGAHDLVVRNLYPIDVLAAGGRHVVASGAPLTPWSFAELALYGAVYAAITIAVAGAGVLVARGGRRRDAVGVAVVAAATLVVLAAAARGPNTTAHDLLDLAFRGLPAVAIALLAVDLRRVLRGDARARSDIVLSAFVAVAALRTYALFLPGSQSLYVLPAAAVLAVRLHVREVARWPGARTAGVVWLALVVLLVASLSVKDAHRETGTVRAAHGTFRSAPADAVALQAAVDAIERSTRPGDPILVGPQLDALTVLTGRTPALRQADLLPGTLTADGGEAAAIARIDRLGVRIAVIDRQPLSDYGTGSFGTSYDRRLGAAIARRFQLMRRIPGANGLEIEIWQRRVT
jgi:hypothetical protein